MLPFFIIKKNNIYIYISLRFEYIHICLESCFTVHNHRNEHDGPLCSLVRFAMSLLKPH